MNIRRIIHTYCPWTLWLWRTYLSIIKAGGEYISWKMALSEQSRIDGYIDQLKRKPGPIRVCFFVYNDACFQQERVFQLMLADKNFDPFIVVISGGDLGSPVMNREQSAVHERSLLSLRRKYGEHVVDSWDGSHYRDFSHMSDLCTSMHGYEKYVNKLYRMSYMTHRGVPSFFVDYGAPVGCVWDEHYWKTGVFSCLWRIYLGSDWFKELLSVKHKELIKRGRVVYSGYPKLDLLNEKKQYVRNRKRIIIAPHHTIKSDECFRLSNFVQYSQFILTLPSRYPEIDWVFRPHPILMAKMVSCGFWTDAEEQEYVRKLSSFTNVEYQRGGDYYETFVNSDALIQDCASFITEYLASGHPQCFVLKNRNTIKEQFLSAGQELLSHMYQAFSEDDIITFIDNVVIKGDDPMKKDRVAFAKKTFMTHYPNISQFIVDDIKKALGRS